MPERKILIAEESGLVIKFFRDTLKPKGYETTEAFTGEEALLKAVSGEPEAMILDISLSKMDGLETLRRMRRAGMNTPVIMLTGYSTLPLALEAIKLGISDFLTKPVLPEKLEKALEKALRFSKPAAKTSMAEKKCGDYAATALHLSTGSSPAITKIHALIKKAAPQNINVLITGEPGTEKEFTARALHYNSPRKDRPLVSLNCPAVPERLAEAELFGLEQGEEKQRQGKLELAEGGTLFLDGIETLPVPVRQKLLRALKEKEIILPGGVSAGVNVRLIAGADTGLEEPNHNGSFQDLLDGFPEFSIRLPSLRERREDLLFLMELLLKELNAETGKLILGFSPRVKELLQKYSWPGNLKELKNVISSAMVSAEHEIEFTDLPLNIQVAVDQRSAERTGDILKAELAKAAGNLEKMLLLRALSEKGRNLIETAKELGVAPDALAGKLKAYNIEKVI
ncbi:MAG: sigma-54 dependent transcriptional regulator [Candidatus Firestonebacteria bacterium]